MKASQVFEAFIDSLVVNQTISADVGGKVKLAIAHRAAELDTALPGAAEPDAKKKGK